MEIQGFTRHLEVQPCFTEEEAKLIIQAADKNMADGTVSGKHGDASIRRSQVHWLDRKEFAWAYERMWAIAVELNKNFFGFQIEKFEGRLQVARYPADQEGFYTWHMDNGEKTPGRKISLSVQLSSPQDYEGGELEFFYTNNVKHVIKTQGSVIAFPSFVMHRVTPVTQGVRYSMVAWVTGPRWS